MNNNVEKELEHFLRLLKQNPTILKFQEIQEQILKDKDLLETIRYFHTLEKHDLAYKETKEKLFRNDKYKIYLELNQEITYWTFEMSQKLKEATRGCQVENY